MNVSSDSTKSYVSPGNNKPGLRPVQDLLKTRNLSISSEFFIKTTTRKSYKTLFINTFQLILRLTYLVAWLRHVAIPFVGLSNKNKSYFLIHKNLSLVHDSSYFMAT